MKVAKFKIGDQVKVAHPLGSWTGTVVCVNLTQNNDWEYEVSGALEKWHYSDGGFMWFPLAWEEQLKLVEAV